MRIVVDLQGCQTKTSRGRGIGRYSLALAQAMARNAGDHEIWLALNGAIRDSIDPIYESFGGLIPEERIRIFHASNPRVDWPVPRRWRRRLHELRREAFLRSLEPDMVHVSSPFEGQDAVISIEQPRSAARYAITLYDLIPLLNQETHLKVRASRDLYMRRLAAARRADLLMAISESSRREALAALNLPEERVVNISSAIDPTFQPMRVTAAETARFRGRYGIEGRFVMYTGGLDPRKNIDGLVAAYAALRPDLRRDSQLVVVCGLKPAERAKLDALARQNGLAPRELVLPGFVDHEQLVLFYNLCSLFVFPSLHEGFGLPVLEAMACGAPTIGANNSSIPEVINFDPALFDAADPRAMAAKMESALTDRLFSNALRDHGMSQSKLFSWDHTAKTALEAMERVRAARTTDH